MNNESQPLFKKCVCASLRFKFVKSNILVNSYQSFPATIVSVSLARVIEIGFGVPVVSNTYSVIVILPLFDIKTGIFETLVPSWTSTSPSLEFIEEIMSLDDSSWIIAVKE